MSNNQRHFLGELCVRIGDYENKVRYLVVANTIDRAQLVLERLAANFYGDGTQAKEDDGYYANQGEVHVSPALLQEIGLASFEELRKFLPVRYDENTTSQEDVDAGRPAGFKALVKSVVNNLEGRKGPPSQSVMLEVLSSAFGAKNWQVLAAKLSEPSAPATSATPEPEPQSPAALAAAAPEPTEGQSMYEVELCRTGYGFASVRLMAHSIGEARERALDEAGDQEYSEKTMDFEVTSARKL